ncbi:MAG: beta-propeller fold lactonase family protein [candidate division Zixibacteria bacterium]|nr:beta-propeller fold lactonase family protein [candidate division Zixibacteria bacterium]
MGGQNGVDGLFGALGATVSRDGRHLYVTGNFENELAVFSRDVTTGKLTFVEIQREGTANVDGMSSPTSVLMSPDGQYVYVTGSGDGALVVFSRNASNGRLTFIEKQQDGRGSTDGLGFPRRAAVSAYGNFVYIASDFDGMSVFKFNDVAPLTPRQFFALSGQRQVTLQWTANFEIDMALYKLYRHTARDSAAASVVLTITHPDTMATDTTVVNGTTYYYWLSAVDTANLESVLTPAAQARPLDTLPAKPATLTAAAGHRRVQLAWSSSPDTDLSHYIVYRETLSSFVPTRQDSIASIFVPDTAYIDTTVFNGTTYYYKVSAVDTLGGESIFSPEASALPSGPTAMTLAGAFAETRFGVVRLAWTVAVSYDHAGFHILRGTTPDGPFERLTPALILPQPEGRYVFDDPTAATGHPYIYRLEAIDTNGAAEIVHTFTLTVSPPKAFELGQNHPNPFNPETSIRFALSEPSRVRITLYNTAGQLVRTLIDEDRNTGFHSIRWDGRNDRRERVSSGLYLYRMEAGGFVFVRKMALVK